ncbi:MAG: Ig-like domain-containing protein, partial [Pseudolabrys sp.]
TVVSATSPASGIPTGTVAFRDGGIILGVSPIIVGTAGLSVLTLNAGSHSITVNYGGDANFIGSTSPPLTENVIFVGKKAKGRRF